MQKVSAKGCGAAFAAVRLLLLKMAAVPDGEFLLFLRTNFTYLVPYELRSSSELGD